jgi:uncharacterized protein
MTNSALEILRKYAISHSLFGPTSLAKAFKRLKFVQADPIRSPARAQDLILRQRVANYRAGDLEREYPALGLEEDVLYAYGFVTRDLWQLLYPRKTNESTPLERKILEAVNNSGETHPSELEARFGRERVVNAWGGYSQATKSSLENLHHRGLLRVTRREKGIRVYGPANFPPAPLPSRPLSLPERLKKLILVTANILAPVTERCLQEALAPLRRSLPPPANTKAVIADLIKSGELQKQSIDGISYLYPPTDLAADQAPRRVRFLAPFDPLVWDRRRFEHFWGWSYRFEAYTPAARRLRGYYAMPMLWDERVIGWANVGARKGVLDASVGFAGEKPNDSDFHQGLEEEIARLETFLNLRNEA